MFRIKKQLNILYSSTIVGSLSLTGAWVAILAARGFTLVEIALTETVFHIVSLIFEIPSGVLADIFGRKKMLVVSRIMQLIANVVMICSNDLFSVCVSVAFIALSYNFSSGSDSALAYDSLKKAGQEGQFEKFNSNMLIIYRVCGALSTLCAGFALVIGHRLAYATDLLMVTVQLFILSGLTEISGREEAVSKSLSAILRAVADCFKESFRFLREIRKVIGLMLCNSLVGAVDVLLLFFIQAKLPEKGVTGLGLGIALMLMQFGGIAGSQLILKVRRSPYGVIFAATLSMVLMGVLLEHSAFPWLMTLGGFLSALGDDALQVRTNAKLQDMFPSEQRATLTSVESFSFSVIMILLTPLAGILFTYW